MRPVLITDDHVDAAHLRRDADTFVPPLTVDSLDKLPSIILEEAT